MTTSTAPLSAMSAPWGAPLRRRGLLLATLAAGLVALPLAHAQPARPVSAADARAVRTVIEGQLQALAADDAARAFSFASPAIRTQFGDAPTFLRMVREAYPVVYRPASVAFFQPEWRDEVVLQVVQMRDAAGRAWLANYQVEKQANGAWRISGCLVLPDAGKAT